MNLPTTLALAAGAFFLVSKMVKAPGDSGPSARQTPPRSVERFPITGSSVLVFGDSQAGGAGRGIADYLREQGYTVTVQSHPGESTRELSERLQSNPPSQDTIIWSTGGNDSPGGTAGPLQQALSRLPNHVIVLAPFPPTYIADPDVSRRVWGPGREGDYFLSSGYAFDMEEVRNEIRSTGVEIIDPTEVFSVPTYLAKPAKGYPLQADGLHASQEIGYALARMVLY